MKRPLFFLAFASVSACSLFTDLDGFTSGSSTTDGGASEGSVTVAEAGEAGEASVVPESDGGVDGGGEGEPLLVVIGGRLDKLFDGTSLDTSYYAPLHEDGGLGAWAPGPSLSSGQDLETRVVAAGGVVYAVLGDQAVSTKKVDAGLDLFSIQPSSFDYRYGACAASSGTTIVRLGGRDGEPVSATVIGTSTPDLAWKSMTDLPDPRYYAGCAASEQYLFHVGGKNAASEHQSTVFVAPLANGVVGKWRTTTPLPATVYWPRLVVIGPRLFVIGGDYDGVDATTVFTAPFDEGGNVGTWQMATPLPRKLSAASVAVWKNRVVITGGYDIANDALSAKTFTAVVDPATGQVGPWAETTPLPAAIGQHGSAFASP